MAQLFAIVNQKGGVGKTTTTLNLGAYLAAAGKRVLVVDLDPQANATSGLGVDHQTIAAGLYEVLVGSHAASDVRLRTLHEGLHLLPTSQNLAGASVELVGREQREFRLAQCLEAMFGRTVPEGAIYYASSKRRRVVPIHQDLRDQVMQVADAVRGMLQSQKLPPPLTGVQATQRCRGCSLRDRCQPEAGQATVLQRATRVLFDPDADVGTQG